MMQQIVIRFTNPLRTITFPLDLERLPSVSLGSFPREKPVLEDLWLYFHPDRFWFIGGHPAGTPKGWRDFQAVSDEDAQAYAQIAGESLPSVPSPAAPPEGSTRKARRTKKPPLLTTPTLRELAARLRDESPKKWNVPAFLELIDEEFAKTGPSTSSVRIDFDEIREKCHRGKDVDAETIESRTLVPTRKALAGFPYRVTSFRVSSKAIYAVVQKTP
jgi:hypothetical protein